MCNILSLAACVDYAGFLDIQAAAGPHPFHTLPHNLLDCGSEVTGSNKISVSHSTMATVRNSTSDGLTRISTLAITVNQADRCWIGVGCWSDGFQWIGVGWARDAS